MDARFSPNWIAYAHMCSLEKEYEQAIIAHSSCGRPYFGYARANVPIPSVSQWSDRTFERTSQWSLKFVGMTNTMLSNMC